MNKRSDALIIIPAYNEAATIGLLLRDIRECIKDVDVVVVDDGSTDDTAAIAKEAGVPVLSLLSNLGIGGALQTGYRYAAERGYQIALQVDADGQHPAEEIPTLISLVRDGDADMVIGSRFVSKTDYKPSFARRLGMRVFSWITSWIGGKSIKDTTSGFRAVNRSLIEQFAERYPEDYPEVETLCLVLRRGYGVKEISVSMRERASGRSSIAGLRSPYYLIKVIIAICVDIFRRKRDFCAPDGAEKHQSTSLNHSQE